jgi:hypothetical protein
MKPDFELSPAASPDSRRSPHVPFRRMPLVFSETARSYNRHAVIRLSLIIGQPGRPGSKISQDVHDMTKDSGMHVPRAFVDGGHRTYARRWRAGTPRLSHGLTPVVMGFTYSALGIGAGLGEEGKESQSTTRC